MFLLTLYITIRYALRFLIIVRRLQLFFASFSIIFGK